MVRDICGARWSLDDKLLLYGTMTFFHPRNKKGDSATDIVRVAGLVATRKRGTTSLCNTQELNCSHTLDISAE